MSFGALKFDWFFFLSLKESRVQVPRTAGRPWAESVILIEEAH